jgi:hypothetical protein
MRFKSINNKTAAVLLVREAIKHASIKYDADGKPSLRGDFDIDGAVGYLKIANFIQQGDSVVTAVQKIFGSLPEPKQIKLASIIEDTIQKNAAYITPDKNQQTALYNQPPSVEQSNNFATPEVKQEKQHALTYTAKNPIDSIAGAGSYGILGGALTGGALLASRAAGAKGLGRYARPAILAASALGGLYGWRKGHSNIEKNTNKTIGGLAEGTYQGLGRGTQAALGTAALAGLGRLAGYKGLGKFVLPVAAIAGSHGFMRGYDSGKQKGYTGMAPVMGQRLANPLKMISDEFDKQF